MGQLAFGIIIFACVLLSAFFSGSETALMRLRKEHLEKDIQEAKGPSAVAVRNLLHSTPRLLVTILLGNNLVNIVGASCASALAIYFFGEKEGIVVASVAMTIIVLIFAEILPKAISARNAKGVAYLVGMPLYLFHQLLRPIHYIFDKVIEPLVRRISKGRTEAEFNKVDEILAIARTGPPLKKTKGPVAIISGAAAAAGMTVSDVMIPRTEITAFPADIPASDLLDKVIDERYTRLPIFEGSVDNILGTVHLKELVRLVRQEKSNIRNVIKPIIQVPERKPILDLLANMQQALIHMAIVKDEFGVTLGLVTQEDILEEIVGEIRDEFDREELLSVQQTSDGNYKALARIRVADFNKQTGWHLTSERGDTLSGLVFNELGRAPKKGDSIDVENYRLKVLDVSGIRVTRVKVEKLAIH